MYLPYELTPQDKPKYAVVVVARSTGAQHAEHIVTDYVQACRLAEAAGGYVLRLDVMADYR